MAFNNEEERKLLKTPLFPHAIKSSVPEEETKECLGPSHMCPWERGGERRPTAPGTTDKREEHKSALWASKWWMAERQLRAKHTIEFVLLRLLKVILLLIFCGRCSYSFLTETLDFHLLGTQMHLSYPKGDFGSRMPGNLSADQNTAAQACWAINGCHNSGVCLSIPVKIDIINITDIICICKSRWQKKDL